MKYLIIPIILFVACTTGPNKVEIPNPFESEYIMNAVKSDLNGTSSFQPLNNNIYKITIETDCEDSKTCPTADIYIQHNFDEDLVYTKDFDIIPGDFSDVLLYPNGKCAVPFSVESGNLELNRLEDGSFRGDFSVDSREINGYQPDSSIGCSQNSYSSEGVRTLSFEGSFTSFEQSETESSN